MKEQKNNRKPFLPQDRLLRILLVLLVVLGLLTSLTGFIVVQDVVATWSMTDLPGAPEIKENPSNPASAATLAPGETPIPTKPAGALDNTSTGPKAEPWDGVSRVTVLMMGLDYRDWEAGEYPRSDTMLLMTIDPISLSAGVLSIPRDLWVEIPGYGYNKINTAYFLGEANHLPEGGPGLAMETVEQLLGVPIDYYAQVDFEAFVKLVDHIQGVKIDVPETITIDPVGPYNKITLQPGRITLNGKDALAYARARYTEGGDFDRAKRTQQVIMAIRDRILDFNMMPELVANAPLIYQDIAGGVRTNLTIDQVIQLALLAQQVPRDNIRMGIIGAQQVQFAKSPDGLDILKPINDQIRIVRDDVFSTGGPVAPIVVTQDAKELMKVEAARVSVQNGSGAEGLASRSTAYFRGEGMNVVEETNAQYSDNSIIYDYSGKPYTVAYLAKLLNIPTGRIFSRFDPNASVDVVVVLGTDWANSNPMP
ncbi:MAG TPA: LCP family protein [Anaerolineaceae bacterium]|nr:LCP family protein [Anaerolineaceae bacterium]HPN51557.1 LCP family protein [Anaerolineaceae bacterium]